MALHPSFLARTPSVVALTTGRLSASFASGPTALGPALQWLARTGLLCPSLARTSSSLSGRQRGHLRSLFFAFVIPGQELFGFFPHLSRSSQRLYQILPDVGPIEPAGLDHSLNDRTRFRSPAGFVSIMVWKGSALLHFGSRFLSSRPHTGQALLSAPSVPT